MIIFVIPIFSYGAMAARQILALKIVVRVHLGKPGLVKSLESKVLRLFVFKLICYRDRLSKFQGAMISFLATEIIFSSIFERPEKKI